MNKLCVKEILIDPRCKINYASYYLYGLYELLGHKIIKFKILDYSITSSRELAAGFGMLVKYADGQEVRIFIDTNDPNSIYDTFYEWCDVYAKINVSEADVNKAKILPIGPSFGVKLWSPMKTIILSLFNYIRVINGNDKYHVPFITYFKDYVYTFWRRTDYLAYSSVCHENSDYVFSVNTLWYDNISLNTTNKYRGEFIKVCKNIFPIFEGGLYYIPGAETEFPPYERYKEEFKDVLIDRRISMKKYLKGTRRSAIVFNTPSVCHCHGWKLAEYLSMGKAIISTPLSNVMPGDFINGLHYICCDDINRMDCVINSIHDDEKRREEIKHNAKKYFDDYLAPIAVINRILSRAYICRN